MSENSVLLEAQSLVHGNRGTDYGHPLDDLTCTAGMWSAYLSHKYGMPVSLEAEDVGLMMVCVKLSRQANKHKRDNLVDGAGYFETVQMIVDERQRRAS